MDENKPLKSTKSTITPRQGEEPYPDANAPLYLMTRRLHRGAWVIYEQEVNQYAATVKTR